MGTPRAASTGLSVAHCLFVSGMLKNTPLRSSHARMCAVTCLATVSV